MITSMTGFGRAEVRRKGHSAIVEIRSVNSRFLEVSVRTPRSLSSREQHIRELLRSSCTRGSLNISIKVERDTAATGGVAVNTKAARAYYKVLNDLKKATKIREEITLRHLLQFPEVLKSDEGPASDEEEWAIVKIGIGKAIERLLAMRMREGRTLQKDLLRRIRSMKKAIGSIERDAGKQVPAEREKLKRRISELVEDPRIIDEKRLEQEIAILSEKIDVTEECVRFRSHLDLFEETLSGKGPAGRKLNFLVQEMNREVNTIGSKVSNAPIQHRVVGLKEEMERVREQLQNIE